MRKTDKKKIDKAITFVLKPLALFQVLIFTKNSFRRYLRNVKDNLAHEWQECKEIPTGTQKTA